MTNPTPYALFWRFWRFGCLAFGGPVAQIAMIREQLIERERWLDRAGFDRLLGAMQALPGPEAHELCVHLGRLRGGVAGGIAAGLGFMLPGLLLMLLVGWAYGAIAGLPGLSAALLGVQLVVLALISVAVWRIGAHAARTPLLLSIAAVVLAGSLLGLPFLALLAAAALAAVLAARPAAAVAAVALCLLVGWAAPGFAPPPATAGAATTFALFLTGLKGGLMTFGGAYTAIPVVRADTVGRGWLADGTFLDGVALANAIPAPLVIFATFTGQQAGGLTGALAITAGMFLPAFALPLLLYRPIAAGLDAPRLRAALEGLAAGAVGLIAATLVPLASGLAPRVAQPLPAMLLVAAALIVARGWRHPAANAIIVAGGALAGLILFR